MKRVGEGEREGKREKEGEKERNRTFTQEVILPYRKQKPKSSRDHKSPYDTKCSVKRQGLLIKILVRIMGSKY